jgi:hypothetical protein
MDVYDVARNNAVRAELNDLSQRINLEALAQRAFEIRGRPCFVPKIAKDGDFLVAATGNVNFRVQLSNGPRKSINVEDDTPWQDWQVSALQKYSDDKGLKRLMEY